MKWWNEVIRRRPGLLPSPSRWIEDLEQDARRGARSMLRAPGFTATAVLTLALGIGATTAVYTVMRSLLLEPLPYPDSERIVYVYQTEAGEEGQGNMSMRNFFDVKEHAEAFDHLAATGGWFDPTYLREDGPVRVDGAFGSTDLFRVLGVEPVLGRGFTTDDTDGVVVVSHGFWQTHLEGRSSVIGETISLDGEPTTVIGVMPEDFRGPMHLDSDLWVHGPIQPSGQRRAKNMTVIGRLAAGVDEVRAANELSIIAAGLRAEHPAVLAETGFGVRALHEQMFGDSRSPLAILLGSAALLLLVGCVNLSSILLARATARQRELSVRLALGAGRGRVVRQLLTEAAVLVAVGGAVGVLLAQWATGTLVALGPAVLQSTEVGMDRGVLFFTVGLMVVTVPAVALLPALRASRTGLRDGLGDRSGAALSRSDLRLRDGLVVAQLAVTVVMLAGGGALARSFASLNASEPGFRTDGIITTEIALSSSGAPNGAGPHGFFEELVAEARALPGVDGAAVSSLVPFSGDFYTTGVRIDGREYADDDYGEMVDRIIVSPEYFSTLRIPVNRGRAFRPGDREGASSVAIVNAHLAEQLFGNEDPVGRRVRLSFADSARTVIGVVGNVRMETLDEPDRGQIYLPLAQAPVSEMTLVARTSGDPLALVPTIRGIVADTRPDQPLGDVATLESLLSEAQRPIKFMTVLLSALALIALAIATAGLYGVSSYFAQRRQLEFGIRMALGARPTDVVALVLRRSLMLIIAGLGVGVVSTVAAGGILTRVLVEVAPPDPWVLTGVALLLALVSLLASALPAVAAGNVDPSSAMAAE